MGKDFRIGLMVGLVLALAALFWVATRPSLTPQVRTPAVSQLSQTDTGDAPPGEKAGPQAGSGQVGHTDRSAAPTGAADMPRPFEPRVETANPAAGAGAQPRGSIPARTEPAPGSPSGTNPPGLPDLTVYERAEKIKTTKFHIVQRGETLSGIARQYYGAPEQWRKILSTNQKAIKDPNRLAPGTKLIIPE